jgi:hypothetical protein
MTSTHKIKCEITHQYKIKLCGGMKYNKQLYKAYINLII